MQGAVLIHGDMLVIRGIQHAGNGVILHIFQVNTAIGAALQDVVGAVAVNQRKDGLGVRGGGNVYRTCCGGVSGGILGQGDGVGVNAVGAVGVGRVARHSSGIVDLVDHSGHVQAKRLNFGFYQSFDGSFISGVGLGDGQRTDALHSRFRCCHSGFVGFCIGSRNGDGRSQLCCNSGTGIGLDDIGIIDKMLVLYPFFRAVLGRPVGCQKYIVDAFDSSDIDGVFAVFFADGFAINFSGGSGGSNDHFHLMPAGGALDVGGIPQGIFAVCIGGAVGGYAPGNARVCNDFSSFACRCNGRAQEERAIGIDTDAEFVLVKIREHLYGRFGLCFCLGAGVIVPKYQRTVFSAKVLCDVSAVCAVDTVGGSGVAAGV